MKTILDLFGNFSENEVKLQALDEYLKIITNILSEDLSLKERLVKDTKNNALALDNEGEEGVASELRKFLLSLN